MYEWVGTYMYIQSTLIIVDSRGTFTSAGVSLADHGYPEANFGGNRQLDGLISLSVVYPSVTIDKQVGR